MNLIVHVGLPKTATTTIQYHLAQSDPVGYLGKFSGYETTNFRQKQELFSKFMSASPVGKNNDIDINKLISWVKDAKQYMVENDVENLIISNERLTSRGGSFENRWPIGVIDEHYNENNDRPLPEFIKTLREYWDFGDVKVILGIRNQPEWLASLYVQRSYRIPGASQKDFECEVDNVLAKRGEYLEWNILIKELQNVLAEEMLQVLLIEDINNELFWRDIAEFTGIISLCCNANNVNLRNVNSLGDLKWKINSRAVPDRSYFNCQEALHGNLHNEIKHCYIKCASIMENLFSSIGIGRGKEIHLTEKLINRIWDRYQLSNKELALLLDRDDLSKLGYMR